MKKWLISLSTLTIWLNLITSLTLTAAMNLIGLPLAESGPSVLAAFLILGSAVPLCHSFVMLVLAYWRMNEARKAYRAHRAEIERQTAEIERQALEAERSLFMTILGHITAKTHNKEQEDSPWSKN